MKKIKGVMLRFRVVGVISCLVWGMGTQVAMATDYYVDKSSTKTSSGTKDCPWHSIADVNNHGPFNSGDKILFIRTIPATRYDASTYPEILHPTRSGTGPITIGADGVGEAPIINANNVVIPSVHFNGTAEVSAAIFLQDQDNWTIQDLEIRNSVSTSTPATRFTNTADRSGILILETQVRTFSNIIIQNNIIRDVYGTTARNTSSTSGTGFRTNKASLYHTGGIYITSTEQGAKMNNVQIISNQLYNIIGEGINFSSTNAFPISSNPGSSVVGAWITSLSTNVIVRGNFIQNTAGDGITVFGTNDELIEYNTVDRAGQLGNQYVNPALTGQALTAVSNWFEAGYGSNDPHNLLTADGGTDCVAAIWPTRHYNGLVQYNEISHTKYFTGDGAALDNDVNLCGITYFQYNYSHDNEGGFFMDCKIKADNLDIQDAHSVVRYNISQNDGYGDNTDNGHDYIGGPKAFCLTRGGAEIYNNVIYSIHNLVILNDYTYYTASIIPFNSTFSNNIFYSTSSTPSIFQSTSNSITAQNMYNNNTFFCANMTTPTNGSNNRPNTNPLFIGLPGTAGNGLNSVGCYKLQPGSPCIGAGTIVTTVNPVNGGLDYYQNKVINPVGNITNPSIGACEVPDYAPYMMLYPR